jgi:hypothetical protein
MTSLATICLAPTNSHSSQCLSLSLPLSDVNERAYRPVAAGFALYEIRRCNARRRGGSLLEAVRLP